MASKNLIYKIARFNDESRNNTLQDLLVIALQKKKMATHRRQKTGSEGRYRLINFHSGYEGMRVGELFDYTEGYRQPLASMDDDAEILELSSLAAPDDKTEFLHSILYFGVSNNHVILSQSMSLRSAQFEDYLNWLLSDNGLLEQGDFVHLNDRIPLGEEEAISNAKGIELVAPISLDPVESGDGNTENISFKPDGAGWDVLKNLLPKEMIPSSLKVGEVIQNRALEVTLKLAWSKLYKKDSTDFLDSFANQMRHVETELDYTIVTRTGRITRNNIKLGETVFVESGSDGLIKRLQMWEKLHGWLSMLIQTESV